MEGSARGFDRTLSEWMRNSARSGGYWITFAPPPPRRARGRNGGEGEAGGAWQAVLTGRTTPVETFHGVQLTHGSARHAIRTGFKLYQGDLVEAATSDALRRPRRRVATGLE
jgi:hypothetical protein